MDIFALAYQGKFDELKQMTSYDPNLVAMGASKRQDEIKEKHGESKWKEEFGDDRKQVDKALKDSIMRDPEDLSLYKKLDGLIQWSLQQGACLLFTFVQPDPSSTPYGKGSSFFTRVKMLSGPGDVKKGSFAGLNNE